MAYVSVPKDLTKVKNKVAFNLTKRQLICIGIGAAMGIPSYFLLRNVMGNSNAATVMVLLMLPAFLFAMYEKDGMHLEDVLMHMIRVKFLRPPVRKYETENYYETDPEQILTIANIFPLHGNRENGFPVLPGHTVLSWSRKTRLDCGLTPAILFKQRKNWTVPA